MENSEWMGTREAARLLGVTPARVRQLLLTGKLKGWKEEGPPNRTDWRIDRQEVLQYLEDRNR